MPNSLPRLLQPASPEAIALAGLWAGLLDLALAGAALWLAVDAWAPPQDLPWKPLRLSEPAGLATGVKLARAGDDPRACRAVLRQGGVEFVEAPERAQGRCRTLDALRLTGGVTPLSPAAPIMTCRQALAYALWDRHVLQPVARRVLAQPVVRVEHYGTYACRNVYHRAAAPLSEHATADAIDVAAFRTADGLRSSVARNYRTHGQAGTFLRAVRRGACRYFHGVLGPDYNRAHADHFHLDWGPYRICS